MNKIKNPSESNYELNRVSSESIEISKQTKLKQYPDYIQMIYLKNKCGESV